MTVGELISLFPADSKVQINIITEPNCLIFIPDPGFYQSNPRTVARVDSLPVTSINIELDEDEYDGKPVVLLMINERKE